MTERPGDEKRGLIERLQAGPVICAEGYLFELERRGYVQAGAFVPEVVLDHPEAVLELHREFVRAGSDVVEAFTYYAHREKMRLIGREHQLEAINLQALALAKQVADETGALVAGDICNTNLYERSDESERTVRAMFEEQVGWAVDAGVDFIIGETYSDLGEALIALDVIKQSDLPAVITIGDASRPDDARRLPARGGVQATRATRRGRRRTQLPSRAGDDVATAEDDQERRVRPRRRVAGAVPDQRASRLSFNRCETTIAS